MYTIAILGLLVFSYSCSDPANPGVSYYFDPVAGNDLNKGTSPESPFHSLSRILTLSLKPGDKILLKSGAEFKEPLYFSGKGDSVSPVIIGKYGGEALPHIRGNGRVAAVHIFNSEYLVLRDIEISNKGNVPTDGLNGLLVELKNFGVAKGITIENLFVHDVFGSLVKENGGGNAIHLINFHDEKTDTILSRFDGLVVQNCHVKDCQRNGIIMWGNWIRKQWFPSRQVIIRNNLVEGVPGDGIVPVACDGALVEYNIMRDCPGTLPATEACDGIWPWSCDNTTVQFNVVQDHKSIVDGYGFDSDWNSTNSLFQYNLSMNNDGGFMLICNSGGWPTDWSIGNKGTRVRYNLSINDGIRNYIPVNKKEYFSPIFHLTGPVYNTLIEKNLFFVTAKSKREIDRTIISLSDWRGYPDSTAFNNNYLFLEEPTRFIDPSLSTRNYSSGNKYKGELLFRGDGFTHFDGLTNRLFWYDKEDENWDKLLNFLSGKTILLNGKELKILDLIGYTSYKN